MLAEEDLAAIPDRYARRGDTGIYSLLRQEAMLAHQERTAKIAALIARKFRSVEGLKLADLGCGTGGHLLDFIRLGFTPSNLIGLELLPERIARARELLPQQVTLYAGDAVQAPIEAESLDIVFQSVVFSSLLSADLQQRVADRMMAWLRPGGAVLWYDFTYDNPRNPDVRGVTAKRIGELFKGHPVESQRVTLAPPLARRVIALGPLAHQALHSMPFLRTHVLAWITK